MEVILCAAFFVLLLVLTAWLGLAIWARWLGRLHNVPPVVAHLHWPIVVVGAGGGAAPVVAFLRGLTLGE